MAWDVSFRRRQLARAFIKEAFTLTLDPPACSWLSTDQTDEYLTNSVLSLRAELLFQQEWAAHREEEAPVEPAEERPLALAS